MDRSHSSYSVGLCRPQVPEGGSGAGGVKIGGLWKRSQGISRFTKPNYKHRVFILTEQALSYYSGTVDVSGRVILLHTCVKTLLQTIQMMTNHKTNVCTSQHFIFLSACTEDRSTERESDSGECSSCGVCGRICILFGPHFTGEIHY